MSTKLAVVTPGLRPRPRQKTARSTALTIETRAEDEDHVDHRSARKRLPSPPGSAGLGTCSGREDQPVAAAVSRAGHVRASGRRGTNR